ncbi:hypothetical protein XA68_17189 [Ophiocordyceps unilateralis]|uniref:Uncharacterized protein n=1 Tax=Ophiocordyceps unilateralis TaxID=268505 RepID=A0A2A9P582_OPHUN|nr:hypothetical protein XA68_17189 [Ophiocordyceps unilateralis]
MRLHAGLALVCAPLALAVLAPARLASPGRRSQSLYSAPSQRNDTLSIASSSRTIPVTTRTSSLPITSNSNSNNNNNNNNNNDDNHSNSTSHDALGNYPSSPITTTRRPESAPPYSMPLRNQSFTLSCKAFNCSVPSTLPPYAMPTDECVSLAPGQADIGISVVYTSTVTFMGNRTDYVPPFEPMTTPVFCPPPVFAPDEPPPPADATSPHKEVLRKKLLRIPVTFVTTDKNPSVAFPSDPPPRYSPTWSVNGVGHADGNHATAHVRTGGGGGGGGGDGGLIPAGSTPRKGNADHKAADNDDRAEGRTGDTAKLRAGAGMPPPSRPIRVTARADQVTIDDRSFTGLAPGATSVVTAADGVVLTILPTAVVGAGASMSKPAPAETGVSVATPRTAVVGGLPVTISGSEAVVGDATLKLAGATATSAPPDHGRPAVVIRAGGLLVVDGRHTLSFGPLVPAPRESDVLVHRGQLLTVEGPPGRAVIADTTWPYGPGIAPTSRVVDGDTIVLGPSGVSVHGLRLGPPLSPTTTTTTTTTPEGNSAASKDAISGIATATATTTYEVVGGASITRIAPSLAIINGATFTVGPGSHRITTAIAGAVFTLGPAGLVVDSLTLTYPFGRVITATLTVTPTAATPTSTPAAVDSPKADEESGARVPDLRRVACLAVVVALAVCFSS